MLNAIIIVLKEFFSICLLRKRPQDLPASPVLFWPVLCGYGAISAILLLPTRTVYFAILTGLIEAMMLLLVTFVFLYLRSVPRRWLQTCTALAGTGIIFSLIAFPLFYWRVFFEIDTGAQTVIGVLVLVLVLWNIVVMTHILRHALSASYILGILGSVTYITLTSLVLQIVLPVEGGM
jgi:hypothetical protein